MLHLLRQLLYKKDITDSVTQGKHRSRSYFRTNMAVLTDLSPMDDSTFQESELLLRVQERKLTNMAGVLQGKYSCVGLANISGIKSLAGLTYWIYESRRAGPSSPTSRSCFPPTYLHFTLMSAQVWLYLLWLQLFCLPLSPFISLHI